MMQGYRDWTGNLEELGAKATEILTRISAQAPSPLSTRLLRDYTARGILGPAERHGRELLFNYDNLLRLVVARVLLADGWMLAKIQEHFALSATSEIEALFPSRRSDALETLARLKRDTRPERNDWLDEQDDPPGLGDQDAPTFRIKRIAQSSSVQMEMREALGRLGLPERGPVTEDLKLIAIAPWFQALIQTDRLRTLTYEEAQDIGAGVTAALTALILKKGHGHD
jgi:DNA-binding transcriptional MerR regulator